MFFSKSDFFKQDNYTLLLKRSSVQNILSYLEIPENNILKAYDYFSIYPDKFDGATIVKDLCSIRDLDLAALEHDYNYIVLLSKYKGLKWLQKKIQYDWLYGKRMEQLGKGIYPYNRSIALIITTPIYWFIKLLANQPKIINV